MTSVQAEPFHTSVESITAPGGLASPPAINPDVCVPNPDLFTPLVFISATSLQDVPFQLSTAVEFPVAYMAAVFVAPK